MLAKKYHFAYDTIRSLCTVHGNRKKMGVYTICIQEVLYPICNMDLVIEQMNVMKKNISNEIDKMAQCGEDEKEKIEGIIRKMMFDTMKDIKLRIVVESGYKESFYYDVEEGEFLFDLTSIQREGGIGSHTYKLSNYSNKGVEWDLAEICPECWKGKWSIVKNSL